MVIIAAAEDGRGEVVADGANGAGAVVMMEKCRSCCCPPPTPVPSPTPPSHFPKGIVLTDVRGNIIAAKQLGRRLSRRARQGMPSAEQPSQAGATKFSKNRIQTHEKRAAEDVFRRTKRFDTPLN